VFPVLFKFGFRFGVVWVALSLVGGVFASLFCIRQTDLKSLIAYSSVAHMSMVIGGIITLSYSGVCRSFALMVAHGLLFPTLFCLYVFHLFNFCFDYFVQFSYLPPRRQSNASIYENSILLNDCLPQ
jgi:NADH:ubiquinone oxidoreductase subunit 4 (subunit M)